MDLRQGRVFRILDGGSARVTEFRTRGAARSSQTNSRARRFMTEVVLNHSPPAPAISLVRPDDRRHARAAEQPPSSAALTYSRPTGRRNVMPRRNMISLRSDGYDQDERRSR
jgi:hypothetical protein